jgi:ribosomal protein L37AE/L43A
LNFGATLRTNFLQSEWSEHSDAVYHKQQREENTMKCPVCTETNLVMSERQGIEIDYCPQCRGVWLDRGELDKIIERSATAAPAQAPQPTPNL